MPYISASIMMQLLTAVIPRLNKLAREDGGRQKITQYTRYVTLGLCIFQVISLRFSMQNPASNPFLQGIESVTARLGPLVENPGFGFQFVAVMALSAGTMFLMWVGDQSPTAGLGTGRRSSSPLASSLRCRGRWCRFGIRFVPFRRSSSRVSPIVLVLMIAFLVLVVSSVIALTQASERLAFSTRNALSAGKSMAVKPSICL